MSKKLSIVLVLLVVVGAGAWYAFPERLFINQRVDEQFPTSSAAINTVAKGSIS